jgi:dihydroorotase
MDTAMTKSIIRGGTVIDATGSRVADVICENGLICEVGKNLDATGANVIDASGCVVSPGLVDIHTHLREPGGEESETIETGTRAAALGGYTAVVAMPNTDPVIDNLSVVREIQAASISASTDVAVAASITLGRQGKELAPIAELVNAGVHMFTDDGSGLQSSRLMRRALEYASMFDAVIASHCEDESLSHGGQMHEGAVSAQLGLPGIPAEAEELMAMRDITLSKRIGGHVHLMHLSTAGSIELVRAAKHAGLPITAEVAPHHFTLTDDEVRTFNPVFKVNPPIRSDEHRQAIKQAIKDGIIDAIATDHAPHSDDKKQRPFDEAPCGMLGLETAFALANTELDIPIESILALMSWQPARLARLDRDHGVTIMPGRPANLAVLDTAAEWFVDPTQMASKSHNTPYAGRKVRGRARHTLLRGTPTVLNGEAQR